MMMVPYQMGEEMLKSRFMESPRLNALVSSVKKQQQILNDPNMAATEKVALSVSLTPEIRKRFKNYCMQQVLGFDDKNEDEPDDMMTTGEQKVLQKMANVLRQRHPTLSSKISSKNRPLPASMLPYHQKNTLNKPMRLMFLERTRKQFRGQRIGI